MMGNLATLLADLGDRGRAAPRELTDEVASGCFMSQSLYNLRTAAVAEALRLQANEAMAVGDVKYKKTLSALRFRMRISATIARVHDCDWPLRACSSMRLARTSPGRGPWST